MIELFILYAVIWVSFCGLMYKDDEGRSNGKRETILAATSLTVLVVAVAHFVQVTADWLVVWMGW